MNQNYTSGPSKSIKVYPGDSVKMEVWAYYEANEGYGTNSVALVSAIAAATLWQRIWPASMARRGSTSLTMTPDASRPRYNQVRFSVNAFGAQPRSVHDTPG